MKEENVWDWLMRRGNEFHILGAETRKARAPNERFYRRLEFYAHSWIISVSLILPVWRINFIITRRVKIRKRAQAGENSVCCYIKTRGQMAETNPSI